LRRLSRTCGVLVLVVVAFAPWGNNARRFVPQGHSWFTFFQGALEDIADRGLELPFRALVPSSPQFVREHAMWSFDACLLAVLLAAIPASGAFIVLAPRRRAQSALLFVALGGTAAASGLLLRNELTDGEWRGFDGPSGAFLCSIVTVVPLLLGAVTAFGVWQRNRQVSMAVDGIFAIACLSVFVSFGPRLGSRVLWGPRAAALLLALAALMEFARAEPVLRLDPERSEEPPLVRRPARWRRIANRASFVLLVLALALAGLLLRRATRPPRLDDPYDDWPLFLDVNKPPPLDSIAEIAFSPKGDLLVTSSNTGLCIWSMPDGCLVRTLDPVGRMTRVAISEDLLAGVLSYVDRVQVHSFADGSIVWGGPPGAHWVGFSPRGDVLAAAGDETVKLLSATRGKLVRELKGGCFAFSPDGETIATGYGPYFHDEPRYAPARIWSTRDGSLVRELEDGESIIWLAFSKGGDLIVGARVNDESSLHLWSAATGRRIRRITVPPGFDLGQPSPEFTRMVVGSKDGIFVEPVSRIDPWNPISRQVTSRGTPFDWSPCEDALAVAVDGTVKRLPVPKATPEDLRFLAPPGSR
jgi:hypothetical protein